MIHDPNVNTRQTISKIHNVHSDHRTLHHFEQSLKCPCELNWHMLENMFIKKIINLMDLNIHYFCPKFIEIHILVHFKRNFLR